MGWFSKAVDAVKSAVGAVTGAATDAADAVGDAVGDAADAVADSATGVAGAIRDLGGDAITSLGDAAGKAYDTVTDVGYELLDPGSSIRNAGELGSRIVGATGDIASKAIDETLGASILPDAIEKVGDKLADAVDEATDLTGDAIEGIAETAGSATDVVRDKTTDGILSAGDAAGSVWVGAKDTAGDAWDAVKDGGRAVGDAANAVGDAAVDAAHTTGEAVGDGAGEVWDAVGSAGKAVTDAAEPVYSGVRDGAEKAFGAVRDIGGDNVSDDEKERLEELTDQQAQRHVQQSVDMRGSMAQVDVEGQAAPDKTDEATGDYRSRSVADGPVVEEGTRARIEDAVSRGSYESAVASGESEADTNELVLEGFAATTEVGTDPASRPGGGDGRPGAGTRRAATASPDARIQAPDEPPRTEIAAEAQAEGLAHGLPGGGDDVVVAGDGVLSDGLEEDVISASEGDGSPGAGTRPAATASPRARIQAPDEPPGTQIAAEAQAEGLAHGLPGDGGDDLAADFLGRVVQATSELGEGSRLELPDAGIQPRTTPFEATDDVHEISIEHETDGLLFVDEALDDIVDEELDPADDNLDL